MSDWWATSLIRIKPGEIAIRGYPIEDMIGRVSFVDMIWLMLRGELPKREQAALFEAALMAAVDHGPQAPSIAAARMAVTCGVGLNNAMASGVNMLGDVHGGAGQQCMGVLASIVDGASLTDVLTQHRYVPGFGHRFHPRDPRRDPLIDLTTKAVEDGVVPGHHLKAALQIEERIVPVPMNIDGATAVVYSELGFAPELGRGLFVLSRSVGILAHAWEERQSGIRIKGPEHRSELPTYTGPPLRHLI